MGVNFTNALMSILIIDITAITFALEATRDVHADTVLAHLRHQRTLVNLLGYTGHWINDGSRSITT